ncbi:MAG: hypothetical protein WCX60_05845, partial [Anaerovoracaceae bacterium]
MIKSKNRLILIVMFCLLATAVTATGIMAGLSSFGANENTTPIYFDGKRLSEGGYIVNQTPFVPVSVVKSLGNTDKLTFDEMGKKLLIDLSKQNIMMADAQTTDFIKKYGGTVHVPLKIFDNVLCVPMDAAEQFLKLSSSISNGTIRIHPYSETDKIAKINENDIRLVTHLHSQGKQASFPLSKGEIVSILSETDNYFKIKTREELTGYVMKSHVEISDVDLS